MNLPGKVSQNAYFSVYYQFENIYNILLQLQHGHFVNEKVFQTILCLCLTCTAYIATSRFQKEKLKNENTKKYRCI